MSTHINTQSYNLQKLNTGLAAANAFTNYKTMQKVSELVELQEVALEQNDILIDEAKRTNQSIESLVDQARKQQDLTIQNTNEIRALHATMKIQHSEEKIRRLKLEIFHNLSSELDEIINTDKSNLEKSVLLFCLNARIEANNLDTAMDDSLENKKIIDEGIAKINLYLNNTLEQLTTDEEKSFDKIIKSIEFCEESEIKKLREESDFARYDDLRDKINHIKSFNGGVYDLVMMYGHYFYYYSETRLNKSKADTSHADALLADDELMFPEDEI